MLNDRKRCLSGRLFTRVQLLGMICLFSLLLAGSTALAFPVISITNHTYSFGDQGSLNYTVTDEYVTCSGPPSSLFQLWSYSSFVFIDQFGTSHSLSGSADYIVSTPESKVCATTGSYPVTLNGGEYLITVTPTSGGGATATLQLEQGYVDLRWVVVGVTYAPPGPSSSVQYTDISGFGNTQTVSNSFTRSNSKSVSVSTGVGVGKAMPQVFKGQITATVDTTGSQMTKDSSSVTTSFQIQNGEKTGGTADAFHPVNHDYDTVWVWLNPVALFTIVDGEAVWNGYGFDGTDQPEMDIVPVPLGILNGDFPMQPDIATSLARSWASTQIFPPGQGSGLTQEDLTQIAAADPFSVSNYGSSEIGFDPPAKTTMDGRFGLSTCTQGDSISYTQPLPGVSPSQASCTVTTSTTNTDTTETSTTYSQTFSLDVSLSATFVASFTADLKTSNTLMWTRDTQKSTTTSTGNVATVTVSGPPCTVSSGACSPQYDSTTDLPANQPVQFDVYVDKQYGSFMFAPIHYYCDTTVTSGCNPK